MSEKRNLPSWMSSRASGCKSNQKKEDDEGEKRGNHSREPQNSNGQSANRGKATATSGSDGPRFSKLLDGVVFVLSGFVNPERSILRSQALEMGAEYQSDWNPDCTLLVCAFPNTPKFRQVQGDCGTIVSKEWISECHNQKKLVPIETYLMNAGKPWRKNSIPPEENQEVLFGKESPPPDKPREKVQRKLSASSSEYGARNHVKDHLPPNEVKKWAFDDLNNTISWLESQDEKPEPSEIQQIAAEGILTCLQDAIESLEQNQDIQRVTEQWSFIPHVVKELAKLEGVNSSKQSLSRKDLLQLAVTCKDIYEREFQNLDGDSRRNNKKLKASEADKGSLKVESKSVNAAYDSDETIEMSEEEIDQAYKTIASKVLKGIGVMSGGIKQRQFSLQRPNLLSRSF